MDALWHIRLFGGLRAERGKQAVTRFRSQKFAALLAYLAFYRDRSHPREVLIELLWPGAVPDAGRLNLRRELSYLRRLLEGPGLTAGSIVEADRFSVQLNPAGVDTDVAKFEEVFERAQAAGSEAERAEILCEAVELYRGELLPGFYQNWIIGEQRRLADRYFQAVDRLTVYFEKTEDRERALDCVRRAVAVDPLREEFHHSLIRLLAATRQPSEALRQYEELERILKEELDVAPSEAMRELAGELKARIARPKPTLPPPAPPGPSAPNRLPTGTVTFLLTDIEGSEGLKGKVGEAWAALLADCNSAVRRLCLEHEGREIKESAGTFTLAFEHASTALACAIAVQRSLTAQAWPEEVGTLRVRTVLDTREAKPRTTETPGGLLRRATAVLLAARAGQILCTESTSGLIRGSRDPDVELNDLGYFRLRNVETPERLFAVEYEGAAPETSSPPDAPRSHTGNLPVRFTAFFGREEELEQLEEMLPVGETRLVTLTGPGGCGKTRLAIEAARLLFEAFRGAVWFVDLQDLTEPFLFWNVILDAMHLPASRQAKPIDRVVETLSCQASLLLLDGVEHFAEECAPLVQELLERTPSLTCLVTSRRLLNLEGEREFPVEPLPVPASTADESPERLLDFASVELFVDRAQAVRPDFQLTRRNAGAVGQLCLRLEGIPLALELAAARAQVLTPARMLAEFEHRFDFLATRKRGVADRHRTLQAAIEWSCRLLPAELQRFFARLSVFRGGWTAEAAEAICEQPNAADGLVHLRDCSLVRIENGGDGGEGPRFQMMETLREFAGGQLSEEQRAALGQRHAAHYLALAEEAEPKLLGEEQAAWLSRLDREHDNLRAALEWYRSSTKGEDPGRRLATALWQFWHVRGYPSEGREHFAELLPEKGIARPSIAQAKALNVAGNLAAEQGDYEAAGRLFEQSLAIQRELGNEPGIACALNNLGLVATGRGDHAAARALFEESLAIHRGLGDKRGLAAALANHGNLAADQGDYETARARYEESLALVRELGDQRSVAASLNNLGNLAEARGDFEAARSLYEEALELNGQLGNRAWEATNLHNLGSVAARLGDDEAARSLLEESLKTWQELGEKRGVAYGLEKLAALFARQGRPERAARLLGAAEALRKAIDAPLSPDDREEYEHTVSALRTALEAEELSAAWSEGGGMRSDEAVALALGQEQR